MTVLGAALQARIRQSGPMSLADYMAECLLHPRYGYYTTRDPFGAAGDFTTAPEISQMYGELAGLCLAQSWLDQGSPSPMTLAELGPGRGTLMADILRATRQVPGFHAAMTVTLLEASPKLRAIQAANLAPYPVRWLQDLSDLPQQPLFVIANEFFDALPIRQFQRSGVWWSERCVGLTGSGLGLGLTAPIAMAALDPRLADTTDGMIVEICPAAPGLIAGLTARIAGHGGVALIVDYGDWISRGDTFQAVKSNAYADPFADPGAVDRTAHVDFAALAAAATPLTHAFTTQGAFLNRLGIASRAAKLAAALAGDRLQSHLLATHRLTGPQEMGTLFKVLALYPSTCPPPPGMC